jgi:ribosome-binding factor A
MPPVVVQRECIMPSRDFKRTDRVGAELRRELGLLVHAAVRDHGLPSASVSDVEVTRDLDWATVWVTALLPQQSEAAVKALNGLAGEFRRSLSRSMRLRRVPELRFKYDDSVDKGERIDALLRQDSPAKAADDQDAD